MMLILLVWIAGMFSHSPSGLYLTLNRAYDPYSGRWLSRDPAGEQTGGSTNFYAYVGNDPVNFTDIGIKNLEWAWA
jgi:RHS repeat-associated protein